MAKNSADLMCCKAYKMEKIKLKQYYLCVPFDIVDGRKRNILLKNFY